ncbi:hypothetical protein Salat_2412200 [Sesamum alatum]|uniref:Uncharacterized protein n=1 Tax=Sesamum alatum TaxID=300844 RepID=A0AAE1XXM3_9LAMI|nr:hypothetical protein Salat_2412200 [Sesamum alatum]
MNDVGDPVDDSSAECISTIEYNPAWNGFKDQLAQSMFNDWRGMHENDRVETPDYYTTHLDSPFEPFDDTNDILSSYQPHATTTANESSAPKKTGSSARKCKQQANNVVDGVFLETLNTFVHSQNDRLGDIAKRIDVDYDIKEPQTRVYQALDVIPQIAKREKIWVAQKLVTNAKNMDLFFSLPDEDKIIMVKIMMNGSI